MTSILPSASAASSSDGAGDRTSPSLTEDVARTTRIRQLIEDLIADPRQLGPDYQPIRRLDDHSLVGVKATGRGRPGTELANTLALLESAQSLGLVERLDWTFRSLAFSDLANRPDLELHLTPEAETFGTLCPPRLAASWAAARRTLRIAGEVYADAIADRDRLRRGLAEMRDWGWRVVLTDLGADSQMWADAALVHPDVVQVDLAAPNRRSPANCAPVVRQASEWGADVMAVGVDTPAALRLAGEIGAKTARGTLCGAPDALAAAG